MAQSFKTGITVDDAAAVSSQAIATNVNADTHNRLTIDAGGKITWGSGSATGDTTLYRDSANTLKTDDAFTAASLAVTGAFTLPTSDGSADQVLVTDGSGNVTWENNTASASAAGSDGQVQYNNGGATGGAGALYYDDANARVGINTTSPDDVLHVVGDVTIEFSDDGALAQPEVTLHRESTTPADGDYLGQLKFAGKNDAGQTVNYAKITGKISDVTDTTEDGLIEIATVKAGSQNIGYRLTSTDLKLINGTGLQVDGDTGIGTTSPDFKLHVHGANANNIILAQSTDATARVNMMDNSTTSNVHVGVGAIGNDMGLWAGNIRQVTIESGGNVGVGNSSPTQKLDVSGTVTATGLAVTGQFTLPSADGSANQVLVTDGAGSVSWSDNNATVTPAGSDGQIQYNNGGALGGASQLYFDDSTARLGVGTSSPGGEIEISADSPTLRFTDTDTDLSDNEITGAIEFYGSDTDDVGLAAYIHADADGTAGAMQLRFGTGTAGFASDRMTIQADGNVGIGTQSPNHSLSFGSPADGSRSLALWENGTAFYGLGNDTNRLAFYASNSSGTAERMVISSDGNVGIGDTSPSYPLSFGAPADGSQQISLWSSALGNYGIGTDTQRITFFAASTGTYAERMVIRGDSGNVGIGTTSPAHPLHVTGSDNRPIRAESSVSGSYIDIQDSATTGEGYVAIGAVGDEARIIAGGTTRMTIDSSGNVGIGTTSPTETLTVDGNIDVVGDARTINFGSLDEGGPHGLEVAPNGTLESALYYRTSPLSWSFEDGSGGKIAEFVSGTLSTAFDTDTLYVDGTNDRVGIGTSSPGYTLDVNGSARVYNGNMIVGTTSTNYKMYLYREDTSTADHINIYNGSTLVGTIGAEDSTWLRLNQEVAKNIYTPRLLRADGGFQSGNGSAATPSYSFQGDANTGMYRRAADEIGFATGGAERVRIGSFGIRGNDSGDVYNFDAFKGNDGSASAPTFSFDSDTNTGMFRKTTDAIGFATGGAERVYIDTQHIYVTSTDSSLVAVDPPTGTGNDAEWVSVFGVYLLRRNSSTAAEKLSIQDDLEGWLTPDMIDSVVPKMWTRDHAPAYPEIGPIAEDMDAISPFLGVKGTTEDGDQVLTGIDRNAYMSLLVLVAKDLRERVADLEAQLDAS